MRIVIALVAFAAFVGCAIQRVPAPIPAVRTTRIWIPLAIPEDVVVCVALPKEHRWSCRTMDELRQILATMDRL